MYAVEDDQALTPPQLPLLANKGPDGALGGGMVTNSMKGEGERLVVVLLSSKRQSVLLGPS